MAKTHITAKAAAYAMLSVFISLSLGGCVMQAEANPIVPKPDMTDTGLGLILTEPDLGSVPPGLNIPGEQELPASYSEMVMAYGKGLMDVLPPWKQPPPPLIGGPPVSEGYFDQRYCERYAYYRKAMELYLLKTLRLDVYDRQVEESGLLFIPVPEDKKGEYQRRSVLGLDHVYIQSSPHIERLSTEDIALLNRLYDENGQSGTVTQEALALVERTYAELIIDLDPTTGAPFPDGVLLMKGGDGTVWNPNSLVVVFLAPYRYDEVGNTAPGDVELSYQREDWLVARLPKIRLQMMEKVGVPVTLVTCKMKDSWDLIFDDQIRRGPSLYAPNPNRPKPS
jgi:hypothetical protein